MFKVRCFSITFAPKETAIIAGYILFVWSERPIFKLNFSLKVFKTFKFRSLIGVGYSELHCKIVICDFFFY